MKLINLKKIIFILVGVVLVSTQAWSTVSVGKNLFSRGRMRLSAYGGTAFSLDQQYLLVGMGVGYFILNGLEAGLDGEAWVGNSPKIYKVTPQLRYVFYRAQRLKPYIGAFYRRTMYEQTLSDLNSYGGRLGVISPLGGRGYAGFGVVYEKILDCNERIYSSCSSTYPEISFSVGF